MLAKYIFPDRILFEYEVRDLVKSHFWCWTLSFWKGFGFCSVNMSFSDRSDFKLCCAKLPGDVKSYSPYVLSWMQVCAS